MTPSVTVPKMLIVFPLVHSQHVSFKSSVGFKLDAFLNMRVTHSYSSRPTWEFYCTTLVVILSNLKSNYGNKYVVFLPWQTCLALKIKRQAGENKDSTIADWPPSTSPQNSLNKPTIAFPVMLHWTQVQLESDKDCALHGTCRATAHALWIWSNQFIAFRLPLIAHTMAITNTHRKPEYK